MENLNEQNVESNDVDSVAETLNESDVVTETDNNTQEPHDDPNSAEEIIYTAQNCHTEQR